MLSFIEEAPDNEALELVAPKLSCRALERLEINFFNAFISTGGQSSDRTTRHRQISSSGRREPIPRPRQRCPDRDHSAQVSPQQPYMLIIANLNSN